MSEPKPTTDVVAKPAPPPRAQIQAEGTLSSIDDAAVYADIAETLLAQTTQPLTVADVQRWPRDGHTIVIVRCDPSASGTRAKKALAIQIETWEPIEEPVT